MPPDQHTIRTNDDANALIETMLHDLEHFRLKCSALGLRAGSQALAAAIAALQSEATLATRH